MRNLNGFVSFFRRDASILTEAELQRVSEVQERLKLKFFLSNISVKAGLLTKQKVGE